MKIFRKGRPEKVLQPLHWTGANGSKAAVVHCKCGADLILQKGDWILKEDGIRNERNKKYVIPCLFCKRQIVKSQADTDAA